MKKIKNNCIGCEEIEWSELKSYEFNELKDKDRDVSKLKNSIVNDGFNFPFFVWAGHRYVVDGTGRRLALLELESEGYNIDKLPIVKIEAESKVRAKKLVLLASSQYGQITQDSYSVFIEDLNEIEIENIELNIESVKEDEDIDFSNINSTAGRERQFKTQSIACPHCNKIFEVQV